MKVYTLSLMNLTILIQVNKLMILKDFARPNEKDAYSIEEEGVKEERGEGEDLQNNDIPIPQDN